MIRVRTDSFIYLTWNEAETGFELKTLIPFLTMITETLHLQPFNMRKYLNLC